VSYQPPPDPYRPAPPPAAPAGQYSPDGRWYWDGRQWIPVTIPGPPWARPYAPPEGRSSAAVALVALASVGAMFLFLGQFVDLLAALATPAGSGLEVAGAVVVILGAIVYIASFIGAAVAVPMWMHRAYRNMPALGEQGMRWSPGWAAGGWFIPIAWFAIPYLCLRELWSSFGDERSLPQQYWTAWIIAYVLQIFNTIFTRVGDRPVGDAFGILDQIAIVIAALLLITMMRRISRRERDRYTELRGY
jgi:hypothetical protein